MSILDFGKVVPLPLYHRLLNFDPATCDAEAASLMELQEDWYAVADALKRMEPGTIALVGDDELFIAALDGELMMQAIFYSGSERNLDDAWPEELCGLYGGGLIRLSHLNKTFVSGWSNPRLEWYWPWISFDSLRAIQTNPPPHFGAGMVMRLACLASSEQQKAPLRKTRLFVARRLALDALEAIVVVGEPPINLVLLIAVIGGDFARERIPEGLHGEIVPCPELAQGNKVLINDQQHRLVRLGQVQPVGLAADLGQQANDVLDREFGANKGHQSKAEL